jgi:hypothetical protein
MQHRLPNLLIPGAAKSGTTSLYHYLSAHPECGMSSPKEPYFFSKGYSPHAVDRYRSCFSEVADSARVVGEASVTYLSNPECPERIRTVLGDGTKFVFLLRNPVERAMSAFCHVGKYAADRRNICDVLLPPTTSLEEALQWEHCEVRKARDENRVNVRPFEQFHDDPCWAFQHLRNSTYLNDLRHFQSVFDQRQMLIVLSEELRREPATTFQRIARFLEIDPDFLPSNLQQEYNTTELVKRGTVVRVVRAVARRVPVRFACRNAVLRATLQKKPCLSGTQRQELAALFAPHNRSLGDEFDLDLETFWT